MYVQAAKASSSNRIITEKNLMNSGNRRSRITKGWNREILNRVLQTKNVESGFGGE
jgi:hypothetical protein